MRLVCKQTRFLDDELQFKAFAYGGLSELGQDDKDLLLRLVSRSLLRTSRSLLPLH